MKMASGDADRTTTERGTVPPLLRFTVRDHGRG
jgi:hypothetical protein